MMKKNLLAWSMTWLLVACNQNANKSNENTAGADSAKKPGSNEQRLMRLKP